MKTESKGFIIAPTLLAVLAILVIGGGAYVYVNKKVINNIAPAVTSEVTTTNFTWILATGVLSDTSLSRIGNWDNNFDIGYYSANGKIYYGLEGWFTGEMGNIDLPTFSVSSITRARNAKDKNNVYFDGSILEGADPISFTVLNKFYGKDANHVFYYDDIVVGANPKDFVILDVDDGRLGRDDAHVYYGGNEVPNADPATFVVLNRVYSKDKNHVFMGFKKIIIDADPKGFRIFSEDGEYGKDNSHVYFEDKMIQGADPVTFSILVENIPTNSSRGPTTGYSKDKNHMYYEDRVIVDADINSFSFDDGYGLARDKNHRYDRGYTLIPEGEIVEPSEIGGCSSVEKSRASYYKYKNKISVGNTIIDYIDASTFKYFGEYDNSASGGMGFSIAYAKDKNNVYYGCGEILKGADPLTFVDMGDGYIKDKNRIWYLPWNGSSGMVDGNINGGVEQSDLATFQVLRDGYAKDKFRIYFTGDSIGDADMTTFTIIEGGYSKDKNNVYYLGKKVEGVNPGNCIAGATGFRGACNPNELGG